MSPATKNLVAVTPGGDITTDMLAGWYLLYSIGELSVPLSRVRKAFKDNGLDPDRLPKERRPEHVMMDACTKSQRISQNGVREEIRAQQVTRDEHFVIYQMTRHVHDEANRVIEHPKALRVLFSFEDNSLAFEPLEGAGMVDVQGLADEIQRYYDEHQSRMPGRSVRTYVRHYIEEAGGERIRDGAYFIAKTHVLGSGSKLREFHGDTIDGAGFIESIMGALGQIFQTSTPDVHDIPCVNDEGQRAFLKRKFIENCAEDAEQFRNDCMELIAGKEDRRRAFRSDKREGLVARRKAMDERRAKFEAIVGEEIGELNRNLKLADQALAKFLVEANA